VGPSIHLVDLYGELLSCDEEYEFIVNKVDSWKGNEIRICQHRTMWC